MIFYVQMFYLLFKMFCIFYSQTINSLIQSRNRITMVNSVKKRNARANTRTATTLLINPMESAVLLITTWTEIQDLLQKLTTWILQHTTARTLTLLGLKHRTDRTNKYQLELKLSWNLHPKEQRKCLINKVYPIWTNNQQYIDVSKFKNVHCFFYCCS